MNDLAAAADPTLVDFNLVYVAEAHATDVWPIRSSRANGNRGPVNFASHKDDTERASVATQFVNDFGLQSNFKVYVDPLPTEDFEKAYAPWPVRIFCLDGHKLSYISEPHDAETPVFEVQRWLIERTLIPDPSARH